jgi:hypothetical protein
VNRECPGPCAGAAILTLNVRIDFLTTRCCSLTLTDRFQVLSTPRMNPHLPPPTLRVASSGGSWMGNLPWQLNGSEWQLAVRLRVLKDKVLWTAHRSRTITEDAKEAK